MPERILIPLDGSKLREDALRYVEGLVSILSTGAKVEVTLFHVITTLKHYVDVHAGVGTIAVSYSKSDLDQMKVKAIEYLQDVGEGLINKGATVSFKIAIETSPAEEIIKVEKELNADLVAMSTHGRAGISRWALGSVTDKVLRGGQVPVLIVRAK